MKKALSLLLSAALALSLLAGCGPSSSGSDVSGSGSDSSSGGSSADTSQTPADAPEVNFMVLSGPTGVGAAQLFR